MAAYRERLTCVAIAVLLLAVYTKAEDPQAYLEILPSGDTQTRAIGSSILLTCKPKVSNTQLIEDMQWLNPQGHPIDSLRNGGQSKPAMYTELHQDKSLSLFFNSLEEKLAGKYTCRGTYTRTIELTKSVTIDTIVAITWENAPEDQYPILGEDFAIQCKVRARPSPSIDWLYNGELIQTNDRYIIETHSLMIKNVQESDDGVYTCRASVPTTGELKERPIRVEVHVRPTIEEIPSPVNIVEGESANINCTAKGKPQPTISWIKSLTQQNLSNADGFRVDPVKGTLTIINVKREDTGEYQCIAENRANLTKANIQVNVIVKPKIMEFENTTTVENKTAEIKCKVFGRPPPSVSFRKFTREKPYTEGGQFQDDRIEVVNKPNDSIGETIGILTIYGVLTSDDGLYECVAQNRGGSAYKNGHLTVQFPPSFADMRNQTIWSWNANKKNLTCTARSIPNATIEWFKNGNERIQNNTDGYFIIFGNGPQSTLQVQPVDKRYYARYKCVASNIHGKREINLNLQEAQVPSNLQQVKMKELTATTIKFDLIPPITRDIPIRTINVQYKENIQIWTQAKNKTWVVGSVYVIEGLKPQTSYEFRFSVENDVGRSQWGSNHFETMPGRTMPNEPQFVITESILDYEISPYSNQYELSWLTPADNGEPIDKYEIRYCQITPSRFQVLENTCTTMDINAPRTRHYLKELWPNTYYRAELRAHNVMGYSKPGSLKFKTARESADSATDYNLITGAGDTCKIAAVAAITAAVMLLSLAI